MHGIVTPSRVSYNVLITDHFCDGCFTPVLALKKRDKVLIRG